MNQCQIYDRSTEISSIIIAGVQRTIEYKLDDGNTISEDVASDSAANVVQYHLTGADQELWVVNDFNRVRQSLQCRVVICQFTHCTAQNLVSVAVLLQDDRPTAMLRRSCHLFSL